MSTNIAPLAGKVVLVTGAAKRLGATCVQRLHQAGAYVVVHYHQSESEALQLADSLNALRPNSAATVGTQLGTRAQAERCIDNALSHWQRLDVLINNASSFYPTPMGSIDDSTVTDLMSSNFCAPLFLSQAAQVELSERKGVIINMADIHAFNPYDIHPVYCSAKAALVMLTRSLAKELAPHVRVNAIAPGAILWPEDGSLSEEQQQRKIQDIPLGRSGTPDDIAELVLYLCSDASGYITGEIIKVDGGRSL